MRSMRGFDRPCRFTQAERFERDAKTESDNGGFVDSRRLPRFAEICEDWLAGKRTHAAGSVL